MFDPKIILAITLLLGSLSVSGSKPPAGGVPIPQHTSGVLSAQ